MIKDCFTCKHKNISFRKSPCDGCFLTADDAYSEWEAQTNADKIRSMTDEELAEWYWWMLRYVQGYTDSRLALSEWLKEEVKT